MKQTHTLIGLALFTAGSLSLPAATTFVSTTSSDFNDAGNWDNGLPDTVAAAGDDDEGIIPAGANVIMSADYQTETGRRFYMTINGSLTVGSHELQLRAGSSGSSSRGYGDVIVDGGSLLIGSGGTLDLAGVGADLFVEGGGSVSFASGANFQASKAISVNGGTLSFGATTVHVGNTQDELMVQNGTVSFDFDASFQHFSLTGQSLVLLLGGGSGIDLNFATAPSLGSSFELINGITTYVGEFSTVTASGLDAGQSIEMLYEGGTLTATVVPEPSSVLLLMGALPFALARRKK
ncbi:PEP-CTERM sorting domain-containing protein [Roseibacillus ishigakijimensis]|uniref:PEP-CTERM sorting domain-containing protein n=1 Tax=Roseibacillus ishigakijimensis TaxID=454146 RepID=A0A934RQQ4_9BACT|nr:PEP-CTERM sorting domain-containing protein [Roseibacillus ishigakijimensis]MBK1833861.1 PEP-CTERM sorting domain-containing protein [Roseibacillus ishigakijimensis]